MLSAILSSLILLICLTLDIRKVNCSVEELRSMLLEAKEYQSSLSKMFYIGGVLPNSHAEAYFRGEIDKLNFDGESISEFITLYDVTMLSSGCPIGDARLVCNKLISKGVFVIVLGGHNITSSAATATSYTGAYYQIPVIGTSSRESTFSDKIAHSSFLRTVPPYSHQADVWVDLLMYFKFTQVVFIHSADLNGRSILERMLFHIDNLSYENSIKITTIIEISPGERGVVIASKLKELAQSPIRVILLYASKSDSDAILREAEKMKITTKDTVWIVNEDSLSSYYVPMGTFGLRLKHAKDQEAHLTDSLKVIALGIQQLHKEAPNNIIDPPNNCTREEPWRNTGRNLYKAIQNQVYYNGKTGKVAFDQNGDRIFAEYDVINVQRRPNDGGEAMSNSQRFISVGKYYYNTVNKIMQLNINTHDIVWSKGSNIQPSGVSIQRHLKVLTIAEAPFTYIENTSSAATCSGDQTICYQTIRETQVKVPKCCKGYCIDLLKAISSANNFTFDIYLPTDRQYGELVYDQNVDHKVWTGMIGELLNKSLEVDLIVAPLTIDVERARVLEFSKPFKYQGIKVLVKREPHKTAFLSILQPFHNNLWISLLGTVHAIALLLWILDRLSPMFRRNGSVTDSIRISDSFWFSWGVILNSGLGEGTPRCLSARVLSMIWAGFAMIIVASYTANLAAFLVLEDIKETISGINDPKLRNPIDDFVFATIKGSAVDAYFRKRTEWSNMYRMLEVNNYYAVEDALEAVRNGSLQAFIWDSTRLEYESTQDCDLVTVGEIFGRSGYGVGLRKGSLWSEMISHTILEFHEGGFMVSLDEKWIWEGPDCPPDKINSPERLGLANLEGIFMMVIGGMFFGIFLIICELIYGRSKRKKEAIRQQKLLQQNNSENYLPDGSMYYGKEGSCSPILPSKSTLLVRQKFFHEREFFFEQLRKISESLAIDTGYPYRLEDMGLEDWLEFHIEMGHYTDFRMNTIPAEALRSILEHVKEDLYHYRN